MPFTYSKYEIIVACSIIMYEGIHMLSKIHEKILPNIFDNLQILYIFMINLRSLLFKKI